MSLKVFSLVFMIILSPLLANKHSMHHSKYAGEESRSIKSLSKQDIDDLNNGRGWGLAKAAELNGMPGPIHVLEMQSEISLNEEQKKAIEKLYEKMKQDAIPIGKKLVNLEKELNQLFENRQITDESLHSILEQISQTRKELRYVHLHAHLQTPKILTDKQITLYNELRGYSSSDPCKNIPKGHDPKMWRLHNNCS